MLNGGAAGDQPSFAEVLAQAQLDADSATSGSDVEADRFAQSLLFLPITSSEAQGIAGQLQSLVADLKSRGLSPSSAAAQKAIAAFVASASQKFNLSGIDSARFQRAASDFAQKQLTIRLPV
jgi:hypothetical protein